MLDIIDNLNDPNLPDNSVLVSFDVVNMFPSIDNESSVKSVKEMLDVRENKNPPTEYILEALRLCLDVIFLCLMTKTFFKLMVQLRSLTCNALTVILLWLILTSELKIMILNPQFGNVLEIMFSLFGHMMSTHYLLF